MDVAAVVVNADGVFGVKMSVSAIFVVVPVVDVSVSEIAFAAAAVFAFVSASVDFVKGVSFNDVVNNVDVVNVSAVIVVATF